MKKPSKADLMEFAERAAKGNGHIIQLHYPFHLPGKTNAQELMFMAGLEQVRRWEGELNPGQDEKARQEMIAERKKAAGILRTLLDQVNGELGAEAATQKLKEAGQKGAGFAKFPAQIDARLKQSPDFRELLQTLLQFGELRFATLGRQQASVEQALNCFATLGAAAIDHGDEYATDMLVRLANYAVTILTALTEKRPESIRPFARQSVQWPLLAEVDPEWPVRAQHLLCKTLELGEDTFHGRLEKSKAYNLEIVARRYARGMVETLETNRNCVKLFALTVKVIRARQQKGDIKLLLKAVPPWVKAATNLGPFSRETANDWLEVGIEMLKQECPNLPKSADWSRITRHWENRGDKPTPGRMWNSIKDALRSPVRTIARQTNKVTQISKPKLGNPIPGTNKV
jgi:hypothetical protein